MMVAKFRATFDNVEATLAEADGEIEISGKVRTDAIVVKDENLSVTSRAPSSLTPSALPKSLFSRLQ